MQMSSPGTRTGGVGLARHSYPSALQNTVDQLESLSYVDRTQFAIDMLGFYFPASNEKTIYGFVISGSADRLQNTSNTNNYVQINQYLYALSAMHFLGNEPGDGFFVRGDVGFARAVIMDDYLSAASDWGNGILLAAGYGWPISRETRILFTAGIANNQIEGESYSATVFTIGGLW
jgi:hypothetical protein